MSSHPVIIQGGMGVSVSNFRLANAVSRLGQLGVVSGTALDVVMVRRLEDGDIGGHIRRAFDHFPFKKMAERIWNKYFVDGGKKETESYRTLPAHTKDGPRESRELQIISNFVEIFLAREGHSNPVGINYLEKIQTPHLASAYGAMLAGVGYVLMGAGIPMRMPGALDRLAVHETATYPLYVAGASADDDTTMVFDPREYMECELPPLDRPFFFPIIASNTLAVTMARKANGRVDGFVIEGPTAGGHNAPPRGKLQVNEIGEPIYGERDVVDLSKMRELGLPFWLAGSYGAPEKLAEALSEGAAGIQVGTAFAYSNESGMADQYKAAVIAMAKESKARVYTDRLVSPSGFPFKVAQVPGTISDPAVQKSRPRICDLGYLREAYKTPEGQIDFRCPSEPVSIYISKGGKEEDTVGRACVCNALMATAGHPQIRAGKHLEAAVVTSGDEVANLGRFIPEGADSYSAEHVINVLLAGVQIPAGASESSAS